MNVHFLDENLSLFEVLIGVAGVTYDEIKGICLVLDTIKSNSSNYLLTEYT